MTSGNRRGALAFAVVISIGTVSLGACSDSSHASAIPPTTTPVRGTATIASFKVPASVYCGSGSATTVRITYDVRHATSQELAVDGLAEPALTAARGTVTERVHCDSLPHTVALVARDSRGARTSQVKYLHTILAPA